MPEESRERALKAQPGDLAAGTLVVAAGLHIAWALGSTWPADSPQALADLVVGVQPVPGPIACASVATALATAAALVAADNHCLESLPRQLRPWVTTGARGAAAILAVRGVGGFALSTLSNHRTDRFRRWDRRLYSPLCLALALAIVDTPRPIRRTSVDHLSE